MTLLPKSQNPSSEGQFLTSRWDKKNASGLSKRDAVLQKLQQEKKFTDTKDLRYIRFEKENLSGVDLSGADLTGASLSESNFSQANLSGVNLSLAKIEHCEFMGTNLSGANLTNAISNFSGFGAANLSEANFFDAQLEQVTLTRANLNGSDFRTATLRGARIRDANLKNAIFINANLQECEFAGTSVKGTDFWNADLKKASLKGLRDYQKANWIGADIRDVDFHGAYLIRRFIMDQNYLYEFRNQSKLHESIYKIWLITSDCGRSFIRWAIFVASFTIFFAILFSFVPMNWGVHEDSFFAPLYFSVITITTLGYGDITPTTLIGEVLSVIEVIIGYCSLGGLLSIFASKMGRRAD
tara:strand:+ start:3031 stop:4095 length:1065 start_codon:yes stop_codon:yes gene_type:complete